MHAKQFFAFASLAIMQASALPTQPGTSLPKREATPVSFLTEKRAVAPSYALSQCASSSNPAVCETDALATMDMASFINYRNQAFDGGHLDWSSDGCSVPILQDISQKFSNEPLGFDFTFACYRHDFGYRNYKVQHRCGTQRAVADNKFEQDMNDWCNANTKDPQPPTAPVKPTAPNKPSAPNYPSCSWWDAGCFARKASMAGDYTIALAQYTKDYAVYLADMTAYAAKYAAYQAQLLYNSIRGSTGCHALAKEYADGVRALAQPFCPT